MTDLQLYESDFEHHNKSVMTRTLEGRIDSWNRSAEDLYGWKKEEAVGRISHELLQTQFPQPLQEIDSELIRKGHWEGKLVHTARNGSRVVVESRWVLESNVQPAAVVEINTRPGDQKVEPDARTDNHRAEGGKQEAVTGDVLRPDSLLPKFANVTLTGAAVYCLLVLFYLVYTSSNGSQLISWSGKVFYFAVPGILAALFFAALTLKPSARINAALVTLSLVLSLYGFEMFLTLSRPRFLDPTKPLLNLDGASVTKKNRQDLKEFIKAKFGVDADVRSRLEVIEGLHGQGVDAVPAVIPRWLLDRKGGENNMVVLGGVSDKLTVLCNESGQYVTYRSDEHGFHNPKGIWNSEQVAVAALGDSYVQGYCVPSEQNFVALARRHYPATLNAGMAGEGPLLMLATFKEYVTPVKPKVVLWFYFEGNDLSDVQSEKKSPLLRKYLEKGFTQNLLYRQSEIDQFLLNYIADEKAKKIRRGERAPDRLREMVRILKLQTVREKSGLVDGASSSIAKEWSGIGDDVDLLIDALARVNDDARAWRGKVIFIYLPDWTRYASVGSSVRLDQRDTILEKVRSLGIPIVDLHPVFQEHGDPLSLFPFRAVGHYTEAGHKLVAERVLKAIQLEDRPS